MNNLDFVCFDFETGGLRSDYHEAIQVAGKAYNARTLEPYPDGEFCSLMKPLHFDRLEDGALKVNGKTREMLAAAPEQKVVWLQFVDWVKRYNPKGTNWTAPIACGKNIRNFDMGFVDALNRLHSPKKEKTVLFNTRTMVDLEDLMFTWFENETEPANMKMDTLRTFFGMSHDSSHDALVDTRQTGTVIMRFLKLHRDLQRRQGKNGKLIKFAGSLAA
jgi:DNA polymerase III epsilon subunit-like protein